jgi:hypothetical protein
VRGKEHILSETVLEMLKYMMQTAVMVNTAQGIARQIVDTVRCAES